MLVDDTRTVWLRGVALQRVPLVLAVSRVVEPGVTAAPGGLRFGWHVPRSRAVRCLEVDACHPLLVLFPLGTPFRGVSGGGALVLVLVWTLYYTVLVGQCTSPRSWVDSAVGSAWLVWLGAGCCGGGRRFYSLLFLLHTQDNKRIISEREGGRRRRVSLMRIGEELERGWKGIAEEMRIGED